MWACLKQQNWLLGLAEAWPGSFRNTDSLHQGIDDLVSQPGLALLEADMLSEPPFALLQLQCSHTLSEPASALLEHRMA